MLNPQQNKKPVSYTHLDVYKRQGTNSPSVIYNKTLLDEAGITSEDNMNRDQFAEKCAEIYEKTGYRSFISNPSQMIEDVYKRQIAPKLRHVEVPESNLVSPNSGSPPDGRSIAV